MGHQSLPLEQHIIHSLITDISSQKKGMQLKRKQQKIMKTERSIAWLEGSQGYDRNTGLILIQTEGKNGSGYWGPPHPLINLWDSSILCCFSSQLVWVHILPGATTDPGIFRRLATLHTDNLLTGISSLPSVNYLVTAVTTNWHPVTCWERYVLQLHLLSFLGRFLSPKNTFNLREMVLLLIYTYYYLFA